VIDCEGAGKLDLGEDQFGISFTMLMEENWAQELAAEGIV